MLVSDHPHLFETGGENYHTEFKGWEYLRGHEGDPWKTRPDPSWVGSPALPAGRATHRPYDDSRTWFRQEADFPGPRTMQTAARWITDNADYHDRFLLFIDEFDPHEPFDTPEPWAKRYDPDWDDELIIWPPYAIRAVERGVITEREARHVRANYGAKLSMIDHWFGKLLDAIDAAGLTDSTAVIVCTDHGHYLGEKDLFGKPGVPHYEPLGHTPLLIRWPGVTHTRIEALTTNVDLHATLADLFGVTAGHRTHGESLVPLLTGQVTRIREWALAGVFGRWVHVLDGTRKYARGPVNGDNLPLSMWSNRWSTMPVNAMPELKLPKPNRRAVLDYMPGSDVPVIRQPFAAGDTLPFWSLGMRKDDHHCYDLNLDPEEAENRLGSADETDMIELLRVALHTVEAPAEQLERLGIS
jgi:arylsulfatase A-like enzyme